MIYSILVGGVKVYQVENSQAEIYQNMKLYLGANWYTNAPGVKIRNIVFKNLVVNGRLKSLSDAYIHFLGLNQFFESEKVIYPTACRRPKTWVFILG